MDKHCSLVESLAGGFRVYIVGSVWFSFWVPTSLQALSKQPLSLSSFVLHQSTYMAPCLRGIPRRGRNLGLRGGSGGRGSPAPRRISPIAIASPPSPRSEESGPSISNSVQSARFKFQSRLNKLLISALVTVIFLEEDEETVSLEAASKEKSPSPSVNSSQSRLEEESSYAPSSQSRLEEESTYAPSEEQAEDIQEMARMKDESTLAPVEEKAKDSQDMAGIQQALPQKKTMEGEPDNTFANILYLKLPPGVNPMEVEDGVEVTWERAPDKDNEQGSGEPK